MHLQTSLFYLPTTIPFASLHPLVAARLFSMGNNDRSTGRPATGASPNTTTAQALELARESAEGASNPHVVTILERAITEIWSKIQAQPQTYVLSKDEFAVFNYFQYRFVGSEVAIAARKRHWDQVGSSNGRS